MNDVAYAKRLYHRYNVSFAVDRIQKLIADVRHDEDIVAVFNEYDQSPEVAASNTIPVR